MSTNSENTGIATGFGVRLREERKRLGKTQAEFAEAGQVGRLAQIQYEAEATTPTTRYLSNIAVAGADLSYLMFGTRAGEAKLRDEQMQRVENAAYDIIEKFAETQPQKKLSADAWRVLFQLTRRHLMDVEMGQAPCELDITALVASQLTGTNS